MVVLPYVIQPFVVYHHCHLPRVFSRAEQQAGECLAALLAESLLKLMRQQTDLCCAAGVKNPLFQLEPEVQVLQRRVQPF
ncbi:MAG: heterodisulfide reductase-related iron-sulfur binding cluster [Halioglobus sp.]